MKIKLISLLIALLCVSVLFVSCSDECTTHLDADGDGICDTEGCEDIVQLPEPEEPNCTDHKDENHDGLCDTENCGTVIITNTVENEVEVVVPITKEELVPMVVKPIPADAVVSDYVNIVYEGDILTFYVHAYTPGYTAETVTVAYRFSEYSYILKTVNKVDAIPDDPATTDVNESKPERKSDTYTYVDDIRKITVELVTTAPYNFTLTPDNPETTDVNEYDYWDESPEFDFYNWGSYSTVLIDGEGYYLFTGNYTRVNEKAIELDYASDIMDLVSYGNNNTMRFTIDETVYVVDEEGDIIHSENAIFFIDRPEFNYVTDAFGIVEQDDKICFFDLTKWLECTYTYALNPVGYSEISVLQNGNVLLQQLSPLPYDAVNYDLIYGDGKADLDYIIVDPVAKTATEAEFGYIIIDVMANDGEAEYLSDKAENIFTVAPIVNGYADTVNAKMLVVSNTLEILCDVSDIAESEPVADGLYVKVVEYNGNYYEAVYDTAGKFLNYLPESYDVFDDCIILGGKGVYTYDLKLKLDLTKYDVIYNSESYMLLRETVKTMVGEGEEEHEVITYKNYYWNTSLEAPTLLFSDDRASFASFGRYYFVVELPVYETDPETQQQIWKSSTRSIYANDGTLICKDIVSNNYTVYPYNIDGEQYILVKTWKTVTVEGEDPVTTYQYFMVNTTAPAPAPAA